MPRHFLSCVLSDASNLGGKKISPVLLFHAVSLLSLSHTNTPMEHRLQKPFVWSASTSHIESKLSNHVIRALR